MLPMKSQLSLKYFQILHGFSYRALGIQNRMGPAMRDSGPRSDCIQKHRPFPARRISGLNNGILNPLIVLLYSGRLYGADTAFEGLALWLTIQVE